MRAAAAQPRRGRVAIHRPEDPPRIQPGCFGADGDLEVLLEGVRIAREIIGAAPVAPFRGAEIFPGEGMTVRSELETVIRRKAETVFCHPAAAAAWGAMRTPCSMGA